MVPFLMVTVGVFVRVGNRAADTRPRKPADSSSDFKDIVYDTSKATMIDRCEIFTCARESSRYLSQSGKFRRMYIDPVGSLELIFE